MELLNIFCVLFKDSRSSMPPLGEYVAFSATEPPASLIIGVVDNFSGRPPPDV